MMTLRILGSIPRVAVYVFGMCVHRSTPPNTVVPWSFTHIVSILTISLSLFFSLLVFCSFPMFNYRLFWYFFSSFCSLVSLLF